MVWPCIHWIDDSHILALIPEGKWEDGKTTSEREHLNYKTTATVELQCFNRKRSLHQQARLRVAVAGCMFIPCWSAAVLSCMCLVSLSGTNISLCAFLLYSSAPGLPRFAALKVVSSVLLVNVQASTFNFLFVRWNRCVVISNSKRSWNDVISQQHLYLIQ